MVVGMVVLLLAGAPEATAAPPCPGEVSDAAREEARLLLAAAEKHEAAGQWARAEEALRQAADLDPASPFPPYALGLALMDRQRFPEAVSAFDRCRTVFRCLREADPSARERLRGRIDQEIQRLQSAVAELERTRLKKKAIPWQEMNNDAQTSLGQSAQVIHGIERYIVGLRRLRQDPDREPAALALALGNAHFQAGALDLAEREFREALLTEPDNGDAHNNLAVVCLATGRFEEAEREMKAAERAGIEVAARLKDEVRKGKKTAARR